MANFIRKLCTNFYQNRPRFVKDMKNILVCFRFTVSTAVHLQNANAEFHKVVYRYYLVEVENVYNYIMQI